MRKSLMVLAMVAALFPLLGCTATLRGGGEFSIGMRNDNFLVLKHTVDGDKEGKTAESKVELDKSLLEMVLPDKDKSPEDESSPDGE